MRVVRNVVAGAVAGAVGTLAMDLELYRRYRADGGEDSFARWEFAEGVTSWDQASAPGQVGRKALRLVTGDDPSDALARPATNVMHWATGVGWGVQFGLLASRSTRHPWLRGLALGPTAWSTSYVVLPLAKVYEPIWRYDARTLAKDLSAHLVYGSAASAAFAVLASGRHRP